MQIRLVGNFYTRKRGGGGVGYINFRKDTEISNSEITQLNLGLAKISLGTYTLHTLYLRVLLF